jgi:hypothetical protein
VWPAGGATASLNVLSESLLQDLLRAAPSPNLMIEVPSFMAVNALHSEAIRALHARGITLLLKGRPLSELPREVLPCFRYSIVDVDEERRVSGSAAPAGVTRSIHYVQAGVRTLAQLEEAVEAGAEVVLLDNFSTRDLSEAVRRVRDRAPRIVLEASGGVTLDRIREIAKTGVDVISIGAITHSARAVDFSFSVRPAEAGRGGSDR